MTLLSSGKLSNKIIDCGAYVDLMPFVTSVYQNDNGTPIWSSNSSLERVNPYWSNTADGQNFHDGKTASEKK